MSKIISDEVAADMLVLLDGYRAEMWKRIHKSPKWDRIESNQRAVVDRINVIIAALESAPSVAEGAGGVPDSQPDPNQACDCDCPRSYDESNRCAVCGKPPAHVIPQPEAPKDWSGHELYGRCMHCVHLSESVDKEPCLSCVEDGHNWQPRTP